MSVTTIERVSAPVEESAGIQWDSIVADWFTDPEPETVDEDPEPEPQSRSFGC